MAQTDTPNPARDDASAVQPSPKPDGTWFGQSRYAMFVHWGLYAKPAGVWKGRSYFGNGEWIQCRGAIRAAEYAELAREFNPVDFDADAWVQLAKDAGMKYIVITSKHHDGFAMFKSAASPFNIVDATPFGRDVLAELADACRRGGLRLGFYYSQTQDWHDPDGDGNYWDPMQAGRDFPKYVRNKARPQIRELLTGYGPVALIWFDMPGAIGHVESREIRDEVRRHQPGCLINSRIGNDLGDYVSLGDNEIPPGPIEGLWETVDTHNDTWGFVAHDTNFKSPREVAQRLMRVVSRGGNYMLNIGPDARGRVPQLSADSLRRAGEWVRAHGEAIYGADPSPIGSAAWGECTARGSRLFLHVFDWPADGRLIVPGRFTAVRSAKLMNSAGPAMPTQVGDDHVQVTVPRIRPDVLIPVVELELDGPVGKLDEQMIIPAMTNRLDATPARRTGCKRKHRDWMERFGEWHHVHVLTEWAPDSRAAWTFRTTQAGEYYVTVRYSSQVTEETPLWRVAVAPGKAGAKGSAAGTDAGGSVAGADGQAGAGAAGTGASEMPGADAEGIIFPLTASGEYATVDGPIRHTRVRMREVCVGLFSIGAGQQTLTLWPVEGPFEKVNVEAVIISPVR